MRSHSLAGALIRLHDAIGRSGAAEKLAPFRPCAPLPRPGIQAVLETYAALSVEQAGFGAAERSLVAAVGLEPLMDTAWWSTLVTALTRPVLSDALSAQLDDLWSRLQLVTSTFPALAALASAPDQPSQAAPSGLVLHVAGEDAMPPSLPRIAGVLEAVSQLWWVAEELTGQRGMLQLVAIVPGVTASLHFDGLDEPMDELRMLLASVWDQALRLPNVSPEQYPALVPGTLPVLDRIGRSGRADAVRVRTATESSVRRLLEAGYVLPVEPVSVTAGILPAAPARPRPAVEDQIEPVRPPGLSEEDISHLAAVIAEERRQLKQAGPPRRMWQGAGTIGTG